jgi:hypothetical protein
MSPPPHTSHTVRWIFPFILMAYVVIALWNAFLQCIVSVKQLHCRCHIIEPISSVHSAIFAVLLLSPSGASRLPFVHLSACNLPYYLAWPFLSSRRLPCFLPGWPETCWNTSSFSHPGVFFPTGRVFLSRNYVTVQRVLVWLIVFSWVFKTPALRSHTYVCGFLISMQGTWMFGYIQWASHGGLIFLALTALVYIWRRNRACVIFL